MQRYNIFYKKRNILHKNSKIHFHIINNEHANIPQLSDLTAVEQFFPLLRAMSSIRQ